MNLVDAVITNIKDDPHFKYGHWWVVVEYLSWGQPGTTSLMFKYKQDTLNVKVGDQIQV